MFCGGCTRSFHAALVESDELLARRRFGDALAIATRALMSRPAEADVTARLRIVRAHSLWHCGRVVAACGEARRAMGESDEPLTLARAKDALALFAWKEGQFDDALARAEDARRIYEARSAPSGIARVLQAKAGLLADEGHLDPALRAQTRRVEALRGATPERLGEALADRSTLLALLGHWDEARADLEGAARLFRRDGEPAGLGLRRATLELYRGDLASARRHLDEAREAERLRPSSPRVLADAGLVASDVLLAAGLGEQAEAEAVAAIRLFVRLEDRGGEGRGRVRRAQALLSLGRLHESIRESRRVLQHPTRAGSGIAALAALTLGRALLRVRPDAAPAAFERAEAAARGRTDLIHAARLGRALATRGAGASEVSAALSALEQWGDRRLLALALAEVQRMGAGEGRTPRQISAPPRGPGRDEGERALVQAALALLGDGDAPERWARAMDAVFPALPFGRAALVSVDCGSFELRPGLRAPRLLPDDDLARTVARRAGGPAIFDLGTDANREAGPARRDIALVAPVREGMWVYVECPGQAMRPDTGLGILVELARLLAAHLVEATPPEEGASIPGLVGRSEPMRVLAGEIARAARSQMPVHLFGETGTGKERVAKALHDLSSRASGPFIAVNAASLGEELFDSQLFGHVRGAFSGAVTDSEGYVSLAQGGTLFIDEVADLRPAGQAKLLRFLQNGEYNRVGEPRLRRANVRVLTAANVPLAQRVVAGLFRDDLLYRLVALTLVVPPLRERGDDVLLLARHFLKAAAERDRVAPPRLSPDVASALRAHRWPGNVRELENEMGRLVVLARGRAACRGDLSPGVVAACAASSGLSLGDVRLAFEREQVVAALRRSDGNRTRAAADLGITRQALYEKIRRFGLAPPVKPA